MLYFEWLQSQQYESSHYPHPPLQAALPHFVWQHYLHPFERELLYGSITTPILKSKGETCMVQEPSHVKQLSPIHVCKTGLSLGAVMQHPCLGAVMQRSRLGAVQRHSLGAVMQHSSLGAVLQCPSLGDVMQRSSLGAVLQHPCKALFRSR
jgi:hypothetical protein